jgi:hypothetical protein
MLGNGWQRRRKRKEAKNPLLRMPQKSVVVVNSAGMSHKADCP